MVCVGGNQSGYALRKPLNLPTSLNILEVTKGCLPLFLFSRRNKGDPDMEQLGSAVEQQDEDVQEGNPLRYVPCIDGEAAANDGQLLHPDHTRLNPRPMCGRRSIFSTLGSTGVNTVDS